MALPRTPNQKAATNRRTMTPLGAGGRSDLVRPEPRPLPTPDTIGARITATWTLAKTKVTDNCSVHEVEEGGSLGVWRVLLEPASASDFSLEAYVNGVALATTYTLAAGNDSGDWDLSGETDLVRGDRVKIAITAAGGDAAMTVKSPVV